MRREAPGTQGDLSQGRDPVSREAGRRDPVSREAGRRNPCLQGDEQVGPPSSGRWTGGTPSPGRRAGGTPSPGRCAGGTTVSREMGRRDPHLQGGGQEGPPSPRRWAGEGTGSRPRCGPQRRCSLPERGGVGVQSLGWSWGSWDKASTEGRGLGREVRGQRSS